MTAIPASRLVLFLALAAGGCAVDLATKRWAFARLGMPGENPPIWLWDRVFGFQTTLNEGALFGLGQGYVWVFAVLSVVAAAGVLYWLFCSGAAKDKLLTVALGAVSGGIFGNLYDRLGLPGLNWNRHVLDQANQVRHRPGDPVYAVRDFIQFQIEPLNFYWPTFNVADMLLVCGAALLVLHIFLHDRQLKRAAQTGRATDAAQSQ
jgi:signal peptidase II